MIKFSLPGYYSQRRILFFFAHLQAEHPEVFIERRCFDSAYDMPPNLIWNGGRVTLDHNMDPVILWKMVDDYKELNIKKFVNYMHDLELLFND